MFWGLKLPICHEVEGRWFSWCHFTSTILHSAISRWMSLWFSLGKLIIREGDAGSWQSSSGKRNGGITLKVYSLLLPWKCFWLRVGRRPAESSRYGSCISLLLNYLRKLEGKIRAWSYLVNFPLNFISLLYIDWLERSIRFNESNHNIVLVL